MNFWRLTVPGLAFLMCAVACASSDTAAQASSPAAATPAAQASSPVAATPAAQVQGLAAAADAINDAMRRHHYDPAALQTTEYKLIETQVRELGWTAQSREAFVADFNALWRNGPFSHVNLATARASAAETAAYLDQMRVGEGATLAWQGDIAVLTVTTMMGVDTIEQIDAACAEIAAAGARALIIDLRANEGGAFAVRPLLEHVVAEPLDAGAFVSRRWAEKMRRAPAKPDVARVAPWRGWSLEAFWRDVEAELVTRVQFAPTAPHYAGPIYVLVSSRTASAAELAADALAASGRAILIGERTRGAMLSQKPFDLPEGLQIYLPIADYFAFHSGRIEGRGVEPHIRTGASEAMTVAIEKARRSGL